MWKLLVGGLVAFTFFASSAYAEETSSYPSSPDQIQPARISDPKEFVTQAGNSGMFEIFSSRLALSKSRSPDIKAFAQMMVDDHMKASAELKQAAASQGNVTLPTALDADHQATLDKLHNAPDAQFDSQYVAMQTKGHLDAVALFSGFVASGPAGALKDFAGKKLPVLKSHYQRVLTLPH